MSWKAERREDLARDETVLDAQKRHHANDRL